ncbi:hypothetical protein scyTo_0017092 [Scyliorhinus torazame]|uniref:TGF-beta propeptide domain-containing protein n=1 Tax=Scyliorhinus torazame TaxID=75743 RepID=A0A401Q471_SCYTO|nr:hypothetical protein [Scyliorhinus torazame]
MEAVPTALWVWLAASILNLSSALYRAEAPRRRTVSSSVVPAEPAAAMAQAWIANSLGVQDQLSSSELYNLHYEALKDR